MEQRKAAALAERKQVRASCFFPDYSSPLLLTDGLEQLEAKLHLYRSGDSEFQAIVQDYGAVLHGIAEKRQWIQSLNM